MPYTPRWTAWVAMSFLAGAAAVPPSPAQPPAERPKFEVASIKLNKDCDPRIGNSSNSPGRLNWICQPIRQLIVSAYGSWDGPQERWPRLESAGGPHWLDTDHYDIIAKADGPAPYWQMVSLMMQSLLEDRFNLKMHMEPKETSVYELTVIGNDPRLKPSAEGSCVPHDYDHPPPPPTPEQRMPPPPDPSKPNAPRLPAYLQSPQRPCGSVNMAFSGPNVSADWLGVTMARFVSFALPGRVGRTIIDKTGLPGMYDIHLEFSQELGPNAHVAGDPDAVPKPDLFQALQQQLGLKLVSAKDPIDVIVVDQVDRPTEN